MASSWDSSWLAWSAGAEFGIYSDEVMVKFVRIAPQPYLLPRSWKEG